MEMFFKEIQRFFTVSSEILLAGILFSLFLIFLLGNTYKKNYNFFFDKYFLILFFGLLVSKIIWVVTNLNTFAKDAWNWLPYHQVQDYLSGTTTYIWFSALPWKAMMFWDSNINIIGVYIVFVMYAYIVSKKNIERGYYTLLIVGIGLIPFFLAYVIYLEYEFLYFSNFSFEFSIGSASIILLGLLGVFLTNSILINKKTEDIKLIKTIRNPKNDMVKEVANLARMNKFRVTKRVSERQVNNPSLPQ